MNVAKSLLKQGVDFRAKGNWVARRPRLAVVSPFVDKSHGTERMVAEWLKFLAETFEIHVYSQDFHDVDLSNVVWHRISKLPGPHLANFLWWFAANRICRAWHRFRGLRYDLVFSPGINCLDADAISVHIVFAELVRRLGPELRFTRNSIGLWPRLLHRKLYYRLAIVLEQMVFAKRKVQLILTAPQTADELKRFYGRTDRLPIVPAGLDLEIFSPQNRLSLRQRARSELSLGGDQIVLLLVGNDWRKKGLFTLLDALEALREQPLVLLVAGADDTAVFEAILAKKTLERTVRFLPTRKDVEFYYAAADLYVGPSLEDTFALPAAEAMACGLPVIISARAGASALVTHGQDGLILTDPTDAKALSKLIHSLCLDEHLRTQLGGCAAKTVLPFTWERSSRELTAILDEILQRKAAFHAQTLTQEP